MKNITLALDDQVLEKARIVAAQGKTTVNALVRQYLADVVDLPAGKAASEEADTRTSHERMRQVLEEGRALYSSRGWFDREEVHDREYQRAQTYFKNRTALLKLVDETEADMGKQRWNRAALYDA